MMMGSFTVCFLHGLLLLFALLVATSGVARAEKIEQCSAETCLPSGGEGQADRESQATDDCVIQQDADFAGGDFDAATDVPSREHCSQVCSVTPGCKAWTFGKAGGPQPNACYLKHSPLPRPEMLMKSDAYDSGTPCAKPKLPRDALSLPTTKLRMQRTAGMVLEALSAQLLAWPWGPCMVLCGLGGACLFILGLQLLAGRMQAMLCLAPMKTCLEEDAEGEAEKKAVLASESNAALATRQATIVVPLCYAPVLEKVQLDNVSKVRYCYTSKEGGSGAIREVCDCANVVDRSKEVDPSSGQATFLLRTGQGTTVRIGEDGQVDVIGLSGSSETFPVPIESGSLVCPLTHIDDRQRLAKAYSEFQNKRLVAAAKI